MKSVLIIQTLLLLLIGCGGKPSRPNVIIIFTDDQGYGDLGSYGIKGFDTPNTFIIAKNGLRFTDNSFSYDQDIFEYSVALNNVKSRYVHAKGLNINECPDFHPGAGGESWVFADEITIK